MKKRLAPGGDIVYGESPFETVQRGMHRLVMADLAYQLGWERGADLGTGSGLLADTLLRSQPSLHLIVVDIFMRADRSLLAKQRLEPFGHRITVHACSTSEAAPLVPDRSLDFVFIDAGHSYGAVRADIAAWRSKVKPGGWFGGHDFHWAHPGVIRAVREAYGDRFEQLPGWIWRAL